MNLLEETKGDLEENGKSLEDVRWIGSKDGEYAMTVEEFVEIAGRTVYHEGYGSAEVATDLVVVGDDWWLERGEYDGSEWWSFNRRPVKKEEAKRIHCLAGRLWQSVKDLHQRDEDDEDDEDE
jgi:hypothetical protein